MIRQYKKKPIPVSVMQWTGDNTQEVIKFGNNKIYETGTASRPGRTVLAIDTLEGTMCPKIGDYVIQGPAGEFWFVRKEIFEETYEEL